MALVPVEEARGSWSTTWLHASGALSLEHTRVMGVVNLTPDSFSDGGRLLAPDRDAPNVSVALRRCKALLEAGADILDVGGESTRPGCEPLEPLRELARVGPVLAALRDQLPHALVSIDTRHAEVARAALGFGAAIVNDISGLSDPAMPEIVARARAGLVLGHLRGEPRSMQDEIRFTDLLREVGEELSAAVERAVNGGVRKQAIVVDPGIGFGKTAEQSAALVAASGELRRMTGCAVMIGASRKSFLAMRSVSPASGRLIASVAAALVASHHGAGIVRVHDVAETVEALSVARMIASAYQHHSHAASERGPGTGER